MNESKEFLKALSDLQASITSIVKNADNPYFKSKYTDLNAIFEEVKPKIAEAGFILIQTVEDDYLHSRLIHIETGEKIESHMKLMTVDPNMQQLGSAITYARRYSILPMLNIECEDDDGNTASGKKVSFEDLETYEDFSEAMDKCTSTKALSSLWYFYREKFAEDSEEYKKLQKQSADMKLKLNNPSLKVEVRK